MDASRAPLPIVSDAQLCILGQAAEILSTAAETASAVAWGKPSTGLGDKPRAQDLGRFAGVAYLAADGVFDAVNVLANFCGDADALASFRTGETRQKRASETYRRLVQESHEPIVRSVKQ